MLGYIRKETTAVYGMYVDFLVLTVMSTTAISTFLNSPFQLIENYL